MRWFAKRRSTGPATDTDERGLPSVSRSPKIARHAGWQRQFIGRGGAGSGFGLLSASASSVYPSCRVQADAQEQRGSADRMKSEPVPASRAAQGKRGTRNDEKSSLIVRIGC